MLLPTLPFLLALASALPTAHLTAEKWLIPRLQMHMMSISTGIPGNSPWPEASKYNSTIDFDLLVPNHAAEGGVLTVNCQSQFPNGTLPVGMAACVPVVAEGGVLEGFGNVEFGMGVYEGLGVRRAELSFVLHITREDGESILEGEIPITANDPSEPSSYLTCLGGAPFDGLRCQIKSYLSVNNDLVIEGVGV